MMETRSGRTHRRSPTFFLCFALILCVGCYANMYDDSTIDEEETAIIRGPVGPGFPMQLTIGDQEKPRKTARMSRLLMCTSVSLRAQCGHLMAWIGVRCWEIASSLCSSR